MRTIADFASSFRTGGLLVGTFVKTPNPAVVEVLAKSSLDFVILDAEHAPFDRRDIDHCVLAAREGGIPVLVRVPSRDPVWIQQALDVGANGVVVPHVRNSKEAVAVARAAHFGDGGRGFAGSTRAADYTKRDIPTHLRLSSQSTIVIVQIEDDEAVPHAREIAAVDGIDGVFIGPVDLSISMGKESPGDDAVRGAMERVAADVRGVGKSAGIFVGSATDFNGYESMNLRFVLVRSDQSFMLSGAETACAELRARA